MTTEKEDAAIHYMVSYMMSQIYAPDMLEQLNDLGDYSYTMEEVRRCIAMIRNMCR